MEPQTLFAIAGYLILPGWLLLIFAPRWNYSARLINAVTIPMLLAVLYIWLAVFHLKGSEGGFNSLEQVRLLFQNPYLLLAGWIHYLAFDLFIGSWEVRDAKRLKIPHLATVPCLLLTFFFGPAGLFCYMMLRFFMRKRILISDEEYA
jgi:hypothetical protein